METGATPVLRCDRNRPSGFNCLAPAKSLLALVLVLETSVEDEDHEETRAIRESLAVIWKGQRKSVRFWSAAALRRHRMSTRFPKRQMTTALQDANARFARANAARWLQDCLNVTSRQWPPQHSTASATGAVAFSLVILMRNSSGPFTRCSHENASGHCAEN